MVKFYPSISDDLREWALKQQVFFIASAPLAGEHVNISPKGLPSSTLSVFDSNHVAYMDATGSGIETVSHVRENGRATIMFCSFDKAPRIMRWFCKGRVIEWDEPEFDVVLDRMGKNRTDGARAILYFEVFKGISPAGKHGRLSILTHPQCKHHVASLCLLYKNASILTTSNSDQRLT